MQSMDELRNRLNLRRQWLQLGLLSASVVTPLLARWNDLRAAERARALADEAEARLRGIGGLAPWTRREAEQRRAELAAKSNGKALTHRKVSARLWLAGAAIGLVAAGAGAYVLVRRRMGAMTEEQEFFDLPAASPNGTSAAHPAPSAATGAHPTATATPAEITAESAGAPETGETPAATAGDGVAAWTAPEVLSTGELPGGATPLTSEGELAGVVYAEGAPFIGNIHTMIYHEADDDDLPAEENRVYFASEAEAHAAGFRRHRDEVLPTEAERAAQQQAGE